MAHSQLSKGASKTVKDVVNALVDTVDAIRFTAFSGRNLAGAITLTGAVVGDRVAGVANTTDGGSAASSFETVISVAGQIQQTAASDLSTKKYTVLLVNGS